jgi:D-3-phosphoglycerate dehydrogenase
MKPTAYLISTARGGIVSEAALLDALERGGLAGAGLDVWEHEPVTPDHPLLSSPLVVATPHTAYFSNASAIELRRRSAALAADVLLGEVPASIVNPAVLERLAAR